MARKTGSHADITGPRIRAAAQMLFARHGFAAVSMRRIAAEVGVQAGALYLYTKDKQSLLFDLMQAHMDDLLAAWAKEDKGATPPEQLDAFARFHIRFHLERPDAVFIAYMELRNLTDKNFAILERQRRAYEASLERILADGRASGDFEFADSKLAAMAIIAMLTGVNTWYRPDGRLNRDEVGEIYARMVRNSVRESR